MLSKTYTKPTKNGGVIALRDRNVAGHFGSAQHFDDQSTTGVADAVQRPRPSELAN